MRVLNIRLALVIALASCGAAAAQQSTSATYNDWVVQCASQSGAPEKKACDMAQTTQVKGKNITFSRIALEETAGGQPTRMEVQVPVNVSFRAPPAFSTPFDHCLPSGCFVEVDLKDDMAKKLLAAEGQGKAMFKDAAGRDVVIPVSFKGFREAFAALAKNGD